MASGRKADTEAKPAKLSKAALRKFFRVFRYMRAQRGLFALGMGCLLLTSLLSAAFPWLIGKLIDAKASTTFWQAPLYDMGNVHSILKLLLLVFAAQAFFGFWRIWTFGSVTENALTQLRSDTYAHLLKLPMDFFSRRRVGELNSRISADVALLQDTFTTVLAEFLRQSVVISVCIAALAYLSPELMATMLATLPVVMLVAVFFGRFIRKLGKQVQDRIAESNVIVDETLQGIQSVKAFSNEGFESRRYGTAVRDARRLALTALRWRGGFVSFIIFCMFGVVVFVVYRAALLKDAGVMSMGEITSFVAFSIMIGASIAGIPEQVTSLLKAVGATERLMDLHDEVGEPVHLGPKGTPLALKGSIAFKQVDFHYASRPDLPVLRGVSFSVEPGQRIALVGPSGAGKSTIASLVLRFYDPVQGAVLVDGKDAREYPLTALRDRMAIVPQEVLLFGGTILENIAYGKPGADQAAIEEAAHKANAHEFISRFPQGYSTVVGERGVQLSGGQRQRIAIARAVLKDPAILILDEATSALDSESERLVQEALDELMKGRTSVVIAHRLSTIRHADKILVLDKGTVVESGTHDELIANSAGLYSSLNRLQVEIA
ncbi:MAG TPA: ABC transporter transmembrane domain-containing protein [Flavobacteriales bacterium]|nr:ABC transporter transmembrane domain-containing protein [Flavobacteriales bacterium]HRP81220.1 ABC transporter transmembrane domain-containing protein [Flavobacteriales bacterium]